jgi:hypothetical protein
MTKIGIMTATNTSDPKFSFKKTSVQPEFRPTLPHDCPPKTALTAA